MKKILALAFGLLLLSACQTAKAPATEDEGVPVTPPAMSEEAAPAAVVAAAFTVTGTEFGFAPKNLSASIGQPVTITFKNTGKYNHNFVIKDLNVESEMAAPGESATVTFTPNAAGTFTFICSIAGHNEAGMNGTLTVK